MARPWTPGPWSTSDRREERGSGIAVVPIHSAADRTPLVAYAAHSDGCDAGDTDADAELIALAPEMAEAILVGPYGRFGPVTCNVCNILAELCSDPLCAIAERLHGIGGAQ